MSRKAFQETELEVCGTKYRLRPTFEAICEIEERLGVGLPAYAIEVARQIRKPGFRDVAAIFYGGLIGAGNPQSLTFEQVGDLVMEHGVTSLIVPTYQFISEIVFKKRDKNDPAPEEKKTEEKASP